MILLYVAELDILKALKISCLYIEIWVWKYPSVWIQLVRFICICTVPLNKAETKKIVPLNKAVTIQSGLLSLFDYRKPKQGIHCWWSSAPELNSYCIEYWEKHIVEFQRNCGIIPSLIKRGRLQVIIGVHYQRLIIFYTDWKLSCSLGLTHTTWTRNSDSLFNSNLTGLQAVRRKNSDHLIKSHNI